MTRELVICDFDGTVTNEDVTDTLMAANQDKHWQQIGKLYDQKKIWHQTMNKHFAKLLRLPPDKLSSLVRSEIKLRDGFTDFTTRCRQKNFSLLLVSSGWDIYIRELLAGFHPVFLTSPAQFLSQDLNSQLPVIANHLVYQPESGTWDLSFPMSEFTCRVSSPCKGCVADYFIKRGFRITAIGNSSSDLCLVRTADRVFSTGSLTAVCHRKGISSVPFTSFSEIVLS